jgi:hypothetical protein
MISYILCSFKTFFIFIMFVYFCSNFLGCIYIFCNGIYFIGKIPIIVLTFKKLQVIKKSSKRKVKLKYLYIGNKVKEITI